MKTLFILLLVHFFQQGTTPGKLTKKIYLNEENCVSIIVVDSITLKCDTIRFERETMLGIHLYSTEKISK